MKKLPHLLVMLAGFVVSNSVLAQSSGDYRTITSGNWDSVSIWQRFDGADWVAPVTPPTEGAGVITIRTADTVISDRNRTVDEVIVAAGAILHLSVFSGTSTFLLHNGPGTDLTSNGRLIIEGNAAINNDSLSGGSTILYTADTLIHMGGVSPEFTFNGSSPQVIIGSGYMGPVILDNAANLEITGTTSFQSIHFSAGKINVTGTGILLVTQYGNGFTGQGNTRFIDGRVACVIYEKDKLIPFLLPMGKGNDYLPLDFTVSQDADVQTNFVLTINDGAPPNRTLPASLQNVSSVRYYTISSNREDVNITEATVRLSYIQNDAVSDPANLRIAKSNGDTWEDLGGTATGSPAGSIVSTVNFTILGDFVLANAAGGGNILPLNITSFRLTKQGTDVSLYWYDEQDASANYYEIERKDVNNNWKIIGTVKANGSGNYSFTDGFYKSPSVYEYRIKQVNKDNNSFYSKQLSVQIQNLVNKLSIVQMFPNPAGPLLNYLAEANTNDILTATITGMNGNLIKKQESKANQLTTIPLTNLASGNYLLIIHNKTTGERIVREFIKK